IAPTRPSRPQLIREALTDVVAGPRERQYLSSLIARDLCHDMRGGAEPVDTQARAITRHAKRAIANESGAEPRRHFGVRSTARHSKAIATIGDRIFRIAAVDRVTAKARGVA